MGRIKSGKWIDFGSFKQRCCHLEQGYAYGRSGDVCEAENPLVRCSERTCFVFQNWGKTKGEIVAESVKGE